MSDYIFRHDRNQLMTKKFASAMRRGFFVVGENFAIYPLVEIIFCRQFDECSPNLIVDFFAAKYFFVL